MKRIFQHLGIRWIIDMHPDNELDLTVIDYLEQQMAHLLLVACQKYQKPIAAELVVSGLVLAAKLTHDSQCSRLDFLKLAGGIWNEINLPDRNLN